MTSSIRPWLSGLCLHVLTATLHLAFRLWGVQIPSLRSFELARSFLDLFGYISHTWMDAPATRVRWTRTRRVDADDWHDGAGLDPGVMTAWAWVGGLGLVWGCFFRHPAWPHLWPCAVDDSPGDLLANGGLVSLETVS
jgi:hypothetical protein